MRFLSQHPTLKVILDHGEQTTDGSTGIVQVKRPMKTMEFRSGVYQTMDRAFIIKVVEYLIRAHQQNFKPSFVIHPEDMVLYGALKNELEARMQLPEGEQREKFPVQNAALGIQGKPEPPAPSTGVLMDVIKSMAVNVESLASEVRELKRDRPVPTKKKGTPGRKPLIPRPEPPEEDAEPAQEFEGAPGAHVSALAFRKSENRHVQSNSTAIAKKAGMKTNMTPDETPVEGAEPTVAPEPAPSDEAAPAAEAAA